MDEFMRISKVSEKYGITKRTLRYYEEIGLLHCIRKDDSDYRYYDSAALTRLEQILLLRNLDFPINRIKDILLSQNSSISNDIFYDRLKSLQEEIDVLVSLKKIVESMIKLNDAGTENINLYQLLKDQLYIHKKVERVLDVQQYTGDVLIIEFGINIVPFAEKLIDEVKNLRRKIETEYHIEIPLIRIRDVENLASNHYRLLLRGVNSANGGLMEMSADAVSATIIADLEKLLLDNLDSFKA